MRRGDIVVTLGRGDFSTKPRPSLVIQADAFIAYHPAVTVCPITSHVTGNGLFRIAVQANAETGLLRDSEVEIDLLQVIRRERLRDVVGSVPEPVMTLVDQALRRWLAL